jgi:hypothetical protein
MYVCVCVCVCVCVALWQTLSGYPSMEDMEDIRMVRLVWNLSPCLNPSQHHAGACLPAIDERVALYS